MTSISGRTILGTSVRLALASLLVGTLLVLFRLNPIEMWVTLWRWLQMAVIDVFGTGLEGLALIGTLIATGAIIVIPIWLVRLLLKLRR